MRTETCVTPHKAMNADPAHGSCKDSHTQGDGPRMHAKMKSKGMRAKKTIPKLIVGRDIQLLEIPKYLNLALVGRFCGKLAGSSSLGEWMGKNWNPLLGYTPSFHILPKGSFLLKVSKEEDKILLLQRSWNWGCLY